MCRSQKSSRGTGPQSAQCGSSSLTMSIAWARSPTNASSTPSHCARGTPSTQLSTPPPCPVSRRICCRIPRRRRWWLWSSGRVHKSSNTDEGGRASVSPPSHFEVRALSSRVRTTVSVSPQSSTRESKCLMPRRDDAGAGGLRSSGGKNCRCSSSSSRILASSSSSSCSRLRRSASLSSMSVRRASAFWGVSIRGSPNSSTWCWSMGNILEKEGLDIGGSAQHMVMMFARTGFSVVTGGSSNRFPAVRKRMICLSLCPS
mmetsp:Transcript_299/g.966  ORF Transcript_299/g.966 Transcript_299/m.966 type:complete len:259 (+) Transcript_299:428-1204(+)